MEMLAAALEKQTRDCSSGHVWAGHSSTNSIKQCQTLKYLQKPDGFD